MPIDPFSGRRALTLAAWAIGVLCSGAAFPAESQHEGEVRHDAPSPAWLSRVTSADAYSQAVADLDPRQRTDFANGARAFADRWRTAIDGQGPWGLGPLANEESCVACHAGKGRTPPAADRGRLRALVLRLSRPGTDTHGEALPDPAYGHQFNDLGVIGVAAEGEATLAYEERRAITLADGTTVPLREPRITLQNLRYGPLAEDTRFSPRAAQPLHGVGLLEAVPDDDLLARAGRQRELGLSGRAARAWDRERQAWAVGRFGRKATQPNLIQQIAAAFADDIGVTSPLYPARTCTSAQRECLDAERFWVDTELAPSTLAVLGTYLRAGAVPARRDAHDASVRRGERLFDSMGCAGCHQPTQRTGKAAALPQLENVRFEPYTDLLLHDLGADLAGPPGHGPDGLERYWRTAPLWGLGSAQAVNPGAVYLHDGRARSVTEAIVWHGGEAQAARDAFVTRSSEEREALLAFLRSL